MWPVRIVSVLHILIAVLGFISFSLGAKEISLPQFELAEGNSYIKVYTEIFSSRVRDGVHKRNSSQRESAFFRYIERKTPEQDEEARWHVGYLDNFTTKGTYQNKKYTNKNYMGTSADVVLKNGAYSTENIKKDNEMEAPFSEEESQHFISHVNGNNFDAVLSSLLSSRSYQVGIPIPLGDEYQQRLGGAGEIELTSLQERWGYKTAMFTIRLTDYMGKDIVDECSYNITALLSDGRITDRLFNCELSLPNNNMPNTIQITSRASYAYSDKKISSFSPTPLANVHPQGKVSDIKYLSDSGILAYLSSDNVGDAHWLTFWDVNQRKPVFSTSVAGDHLTYSEQEHTLAAVSSGSATRIAETYIPLGDKYSQFGQYLGYDPERGFISSTVMSKYIVTLNQKNELEVLNPGYNKIITRTTIKGMKAEQLALNENGSGIVANQQGELKRFTLNIEGKARFTFNDSVIRLSNFFDTNRPGALSYLDIHPQKPIVIYCSQEQRLCGVINYEEKTHQQVFTRQLTFSSGYSQLVSSQGRYNLSGEMLQHFENTQIMLNKLIAVAEDKNSLFVSGNDIEQGGQYAVDIRSLDDGVRLDRIQASTKPIIGALTLDNVVLTYSSDPWTQKTNYQFIYLDTFKVEKHEVPMFINKFDMHEGNFLLQTPELTFVANSKNSNNPKIIKKKITDIVKVKGGILYSVANEIYRYDFKTKEETLLYKLDEKIHEFIVLNESGTQIAARMDYAKIALPHIGKTIQSSYSNAPHDALLKVSDSGDFLVSGSREDEGGFYNPDIPLVVRYDSNGNQKDVLAPTWNTQTLMYTPDNKYLWEADKEGNILVKSLISGSVIEQFPAHQGEITSINQLRDGVIMTTSTDGTIKLWHEKIHYLDFKSSDLSTASTIIIDSDIGKRNHKLIATLIVDSDGEIIASTPDGYYWGTPKGIHRAAFVDNKTLFDYRRYDLLLNRPNVVLERIGMAKQEQIEIWSKLVKIRRSRQPHFSTTLHRTEAPYKFTINGPKNYEPGDSVLLRWNTSDFFGGKLHISVNESPLYGLSGLDVNESKGNVSIELSEGINTIRAYITGSDGTVSRNQSLSYYRRPTKNKPELYILAVGVSNYSNPALNLNYAGKDAQDITNLMQHSQEFSRVHTLQILNENATKEKIEQAKAFVQQAGAND